MLESVRLRLCPFARCDVDELYTIRRDVDAMAFWDWPADCNLDETRAVAELMLSEMEAGISIYWTARLKSTDKFVGLFDLSELGTAMNAELGFMVERSQWGQGLASEACERIIEEVWSMGFNRVTARMHTSNERSLRLLRRLGFRHSKVPSALVTVRPGVTRKCSFLEVARPLR